MTGTKWQTDVLLLSEVWFLERSELAVGEDDLHQPCPPTGGLRRALPLVKVVTATFDCFLPCDRTVVVDEARVELA